MLLHFDLSPDGRFAEGKLELHQGMLICTVGGKEYYHAEPSEFTEPRVTGSVGCGYLEAKRNGEDFILCRMTTRCLKAAGEFAKALAYYNETGLDSDLSDSEIRRCPKCGRPLPEDSRICMFCAKSGTVLLRALDFMKPHLKMFLAGSLLIALSNLIYAITPRLNAILVDKTLTGSDPAGSTVSRVLLLCGAMLLARTVGEFVQIVGSRFINRVGSNFAVTLRHILYEKVQQLSMSSLGRKTSGDLLKRITQDTQRVREFLIWDGRMLLEMVILFVVIGVVLFAAEWRLALLILLPAPFAFWIYSKIWDKLMLRYDKQWILNSRANSILHDIIQGIRVVKSFGTEKREIGKFSEACRKSAQIGMQNERLFSLINPSLNFLITVGQYFVLYFGGKMVLGREMTLGELLEFTMYFGYIYGPMQWMVSLPRVLADTITSLLKIFEILDEEPEIRDEMPEDINEIKGRITFNNVSFGYKSYEPVLHNISLDIAQGEMIGLVGPSGTGKSTLINLVMRLYDVGDGVLSIDGTDIRKIPLQVLHENIGVVFQENYLFAGTIYDNLAYARPDATPEQIIAAAKVANAHEFIIKLPDGYNTLVGEHGYSMSGGERQRIAIARAILRDPPILILDEATSSLDVETEALIQEAMARLTKGRTTIAIAHRLSTLRGADRIIVLDRGRLAESGSHMELMRKNDGVYRRLVLAQLQTQSVKHSAD